MRIKALCIKEPWAGMIRDKLKDIETRTWNTTYRGPLLLIASRNPKTELSGKAFAYVRLAVSRKMRPEDAKRACVPWEKGKWSWIFEDIKILINPYPMPKGQLGIFTVKIPDHVLQFEMRKALEATKPKITVDDVKWQQQYMEEVPWYITKAEDWEPKKGFNPKKDYEDMVIRENPNHRLSMLNAVDPYGKVWSKEERKRILEDKGYEQGKYIEG